MVKKKKQRSTEKLDIKNHVLVPKHEKCSENEKKNILQKYHAAQNNLPKIFINDPALYEMDLKPGDMIRITRNSAVAGEIVFYRIVIEV
jgi:DNA-directed RNA polymerase subunit H (RpoH/RPB5)